MPCTGWRAMFTSWISSTITPRVKAPEIVEVKMIA